MSDLAPLDSDELALATMVLDDKALREIERETGRPYSTIRLIVLRPHVQAYIERVRSDAMEEVRRMKLKGARIGMQTLIEMAQNEKTPSGARASAAGKLVEVCVPRDRLEVLHSGNPEAPIEHIHAGQIAAGLSDEALAAAVEMLEAREALRRLGVDGSEGSG